MWCVVLQPKGTTRNAMLPAGVKAAPLENSALSNILRRATAPERIGTWPHEGGATVYLYGYKTGKPGTENKHELLPPYNEVSLFGEALVFAAKDDALVSFSTTDYTKFYNATLRAVDEGSEREEESDGDDVEDAEDAEEEDAAVAAEESDAASDSSEDDSESEASSSESEDGDGGEESDGDAPAPPPKRFVPAKPKRLPKKVQNLYTLPELVADSGASAAAAAGGAGGAAAATELHPMRRNALRVLEMRCKDILNSDERIAFERGIFNATLQDGKRRAIHCVWENPDFQTLYEILAKRSISNIDGKSYIGNARLLERMRDGEFGPQDIAFMSFSDLYPEQWRTLSEQAMKREAKMLEVDKSMATDMFRCSKCGKRQCTYYEMQTRSADEPMTQFIRCLNCGKQWRQ